MRCEKKKKNCHPFRQSYTCFKKAAKLGQRSVDFKINSESADTRTVTNEQTSRALHDGERILR